MKKLMIGACVVLSALVSQAVAVNWAVDELKDVNGVTWSESSQFSTYSAICSFYDKDGGFLATSTGSFDDEFGEFAGGWNKNPTPATTTPYYAQLVITDKDGNTLTSDMAAFTTTGSATYSLNFGSGNGFETRSKKFDQSGANYGWQTVPEPTSGLLLLLGVAGLALKRKRA